MCLVDSMEHNGIDFYAQGLSWALPITSHQLPVRVPPCIPLPLSERPLNLKPYYLAYNGFLLITCLPVKALYYWLYSQIHFSFPATTIFTSRGALLTRVFLAGLDVGWLHFADMHPSCCVAKIASYYFYIPSWQGVWLCNIFSFHSRKKRVGATLWMKIRTHIMRNSDYCFPTRERRNTYQHDSSSHPPSLHLVFPISLFICLLNIYYLESMLLKTW